MNNVKQELDKIDKKNQLNKNQSNTQKNEEILEKFKQQIHKLIINNYNPDTKESNIFISREEYTTLKECNSLSCEQYLLDNGFIGKYKEYGPMYAFSDHLCVKTINDTTMLSVCILKT